MSLLRLCPKGTLTIRNAMAILGQAAHRSPSGDLPAFIATEFARYLRCGILRHCFARARCSSCRNEILAAFASENRGVYPSCCPKRLRFLLAWCPS
jgi:hypothetical protein